MANKLIAQGAEASIFEEKNLVIKKRIPKKYRIKQLDDKLRKQRTRTESKLLEKASKIINVPKLLKTSVDTLILEKIKGKKLASNLEKLNYQSICKQIGTSLAKLHDNDLIHGDLTTSNMIYNDKNKKIYFIDFGLGFHSSRIEDKAVDLHLIKEALEAKHPTIYEKAFKAILEGYKSSKNYKETITRLQKVETRGRYKAQY